MQNRERLNRQLLLLQLEANGHADERGYAKDIRDWLELTGHRPSTARRAIAHPAARPSLRDPGARSAPARTRRATRASDDITPGPGTIYPNNRLSSQHEKRRDGY